MFHAAFGLTLLLGVDCLSLGPGMGSSFTVFKTAGKWQARAAVLSPGRLVKPLAVLPPELPVRGLAWARECAFLTPSQVMLVPPVPGQT